MSGRRKNNGNNGESTAAQDACESAVEQKADEIAAAIVLVGGRKLTAENVCNTTVGSLLDTCAKNGIVLEVRFTSQKAQDLTAE